MSWKFLKYQHGEVEQDPTQEEQFDNDGVDLEQALLRETVQNSLDAVRLSDDGTPSEKVRVRVRFVNLGDTSEHANRLRDLVSALEPHIAACGRDLGAVLKKDASVLVIEDFGTKGLCGSADSMDSGDFSNFWRRMGLSKKGGTTLGRWGLGKIVFPMASQVRAFFGYTVRWDDDRRLFMGGALLQTHEIDGERYKAHGFYAQHQSNGFQVPFEEQSLLRWNLDTLGITRKNDEPGLSIAVPFPREEVTVEAMITTTVRDFFYPILTAQLEVQIGEVLLNDETIRGHVDGVFDGADGLFDFVQEAWTTPPERLIEAKDTWVSKKVKEEVFSEEQLDSLRESFAKGETVGVQLPLTISKHGELNRATYVKAFLRSVPDAVRGHDLYVRGRITLPEERKLGQRRAYGLLLAEEAVISEFLGDAENPAHTKWNSKAKRLSAYVAARGRITRIRRSLPELYDLLAQAQNREDRSALQRFFSRPGIEHDPSDTKVSSDSIPPASPPPVPPSRHPLRIRRIEGGFAASLKRAASTVLPVDVEFEVVYDVVRGRPKYHPADFNLDDSEIVVQATGVEVVSRSLNRIVVRFTHSDGSLKVVGFDRKRDLVVHASVDSLVEGA
ncbi:MAG: hypothetical protein H6739_36080 [Alphaproteobacteria bacterium]|nr:hypothetical protein [Alphaproteobacteria bacterium]